MTSSPYRPDIDGLRAIAVLAVLVHHLKAELLPGGYVGVDIFFVISGFLITSQVYGELLAGHFSFLAFYKRRINRIVPALLTMVVATLAVGLLLLSPADLVQAAKSAFFSMVGFSNVFFWREYGNYFAGNSAEAPLLHTWSLGIEEQFYFVWPVLLSLIARIKSTRLAVALIVVATTLAVVVSEVSVGYAASASYYLLPTRAFELLIGALLAVGFKNRRPPSVAVADLMAMSGLALITLSLALLDRTSKFPGINALWPCLGTALLIHAGSISRTRILLTSRPMVFVGRISYSLYLWHWPIIAYLHYAGIQIGVATGLGAASAAVVLAWLSFNFVETPIRRTNQTSRFKAVALNRFAIPVALLGCFSVVISRTDGLPSRFDPRVIQLESYVAAKPELLRKGCHVPSALYDRPIDRRCRLGVGKDLPDAILIGDSYANHFTGMVDVLAKSQGLSIVDYTMDGCPPLLDYTASASPTYAQRCIARNKAVYAAIKTDGYSRVILAANWPRDGEAGAALERSLERLAQDGARVTLILGNSTIERASSCPIRMLMLRRHGTCEAPQEAAPLYLAAVRKKHPDVMVIDPNLAICASGRCNPMKEEVLLYRDSGHLNDVGSRLIGRLLKDAGVKL